MAGTSDQVLRRVAAASKNQLAANKEGVHLACVSGRSLEHLQQANPVKSPQDRSPLAKQVCLSERRNADPEGSAAVIR